MNPHFHHLLNLRSRRRNFLLAAGFLTSFALASQKPRRVLAQPKYADYPFSLGVASGDPDAESVVLWTRLAPNPLQGISMPPADVPVQWQIARDETFTQVVGSGTALATPELAHSVHVVASGLDPDRWYWYQFRTGDALSPIGRTRTLPAPNSQPQQLALATVSCQNYEHGYYPAYRHLAEEDLDFVLHLGDYIYEYAAKPDSTHPRQHIGAETIDLDGYRLRYAQYKSDPDLQAAHAAFPFICTWDDHDVENDYANDQSENFDPAEQFLRRRAAAYQAYYEHLPLRPLSQPQGTQMQLYRRFAFGRLAEFSVLDTRQYRSDQACPTPEKGGGRLLTDCAERLDPTRTMLGEEQERWLFEGLSQSRSSWNVIAQQYLVSQFKQKSEGQTAYWSECWDGYPVSRQRILDFLAQQQPSNPIFLGGDIHSFWVSDLKQDFDDLKSAIVASEFVCTSISSAGIPYDRIAPLLPDSPHVRFFDSRQRGYIRARITPDAWTTDLRVVSTVAQPEATVSTLATYVVEAGKAGAISAISHQPPTT